MYRIAGNISLVVVRENHENLDLAKIPRYTVYKSLYTRFHSQIEIEK